MGEPNRLFDLTGRVALVTGASTGLGKRFARVLSSAGADVVVTGRRRDSLDALEEQIGASLVAADLSTDAGRVAVLESVSSSHGRLDILVNNAGICDGGPLEDQSLEQLRDVIEIDLVAVIDMCRLAAPMLFRSEHTPAS